MVKLAVIGLDGVNWKILNQAIDKGLMPNLEEILEESYKAELETTYPSVTGPAWTSIVTGDNPGRHGVYDFVNHVEEGRPYTSSDIDTRTIIQEVAERGEVSVVNLPLSYPPSFKGEFVGSFLAPEDDFVRPEKLEERFDFDSYKKSLTAAEKTFSVIESSDRAARDKKRLLETIIDDQDLFFTLFSAPDWVMHNHYREMESGDREEAFEVFETIDKALGTVKECSDNVILLSDHGFHAFDKVFHVNQWLKENGYLETKGAMEADWAKNPFIKKALDFVTGRKNTRKLARKIYLRAEKTLPLPENVKVRLAGAMSDGIDMDNSKAFCPSSGIRGIYINDERFRDVAEQPGKLRKNLIEDLPDYMHPKRSEEVFEGQNFSEAPDIVFEEKTHRISRSIYGDVESERKVNHHGRKGFLVASGRDFGMGEGSHVLYDVAPTIAELFGLDFSSDGESLPIVDSQKELSKNIADDIEF